MDNAQAGEAAIGTGDRSRPSAALPTLCATQITSQGIADRRRRRPVDDRDNRRLLRRPYTLFAPPTRHGSEGKLVEGRSHGHSRQQPGDGSV